VFFGWRGLIDNPLDRLCGQLPSAQPPAGVADRPRWRLYFKADLDQASDDFGKRRCIGLIFSPPNDGSPNHGVGAETHERVRKRLLLSHCEAPVYIARLAITSGPALRHEQARISRKIVPLPGLKAATFIEELRKSPLHAVPRERKPANRKPRGPRKREDRSEYFKKGTRKPKADH
jgi:hypothetical protein